MTNVIVSHTPAAVLSSFSFVNSEIAALAHCLAALVALFEPLDRLVPLCRLKLVIPLDLYFLFFVSAAGGVLGAESMLPALEVGVEPSLLEVGVTLLSLEMRVVLPSSLSLFESLRRRRRPDKA
jgi:hypothetical protein